MRIEEIEQENKQEINKQDNQLLAQFMHDAIERGMAMPSTSTPAIEDRQRNERYR